MSKLVACLGRNVAITRFGYEPKRGFKNDDSDESDTESDVDSESFDYRKSKPDLDLNLLGVLI